MLCNVGIERESEPCTGDDDDEGEGKWSIVLLLRLAKQPAPPTLKPAMIT